MIGVAITGSSSFVARDIVNILSSQFAIEYLLRDDTNRYYSDRNNQASSLNYTLSSVIHIGACSPLGDATSKKNYRQNLTLAKNLTAWAEEAGVSTIIYFSTMAVFEASEDEVIDSFSSPTFYKESYGESKYLAQQHLNHWVSQRSDRKVFSLLLPGILGNGARGTFIPRMVDAILNKQPVHLNGKHLKFNGLVHSSHLADFVAKLITRSEKLASNSLAIGANDVISLIDVVGIVEEYFDKKATVFEVMSGRKSFIIDPFKAHGYGLQKYSVKKALELYLESY